MQPPLASLPATRPLWQLPPVMLRAELVQRLPQASPRLLVPELLLPELLLPELLLPLAPYLLQASPLRTSFPPSTFCHRPRLKRQALDPRHS